MQVHTAVNIRWSFLLPLLLILVINTVWFFLFERVGLLVGAQMGTDGYQEIVENLARGSGYTSAVAKPSTIEYGT
jgi:hypothetical protein